VVVVVEEGVACSMRGHTEAYMRALVEGEVVVVVEEQGHKLVERRLVEVVVEGSM